jgi:aspartate/methionine/tyrosine aminotransferase
MGELSLRTALSTELNHQYNGDITPDDICMTTGCNMAFLAVVMALCPPNESSVLLPLPTYFNNAMSLSLISVSPIYIPCDPDNSFSASLPAARKSLELAKKENGKVKPRMIVIVSPSNPTGAVYTPEELMEWYNLAKEYGLALVLDETYRDFVEGKPHGLFELEDWRKTVISIGSFSSGFYSLGLGGESADGCRGI